MTFRHARIAAILLTLLLFGFHSLTAGADGPEAVVPPPSTASRCGADFQTCSVSDAATWCCPIQATGAYVCCGAVAGVCHACDVEALPEELHSPVAVPTPTDLPSAD